ncbi:MAG TPA: Hsp20/alpha crystallin family protein [bacterium]|jgi:HSP20 family protein|nr:Hsp20/alpha crystallin family protein [bacterium]
MYMIPFAREAGALGRWQNFGGVSDPFLRLFNEHARGGLAEFSPSLDVKEGKDAYTVQADLPGVERKDIAVSVEDGVLSVSGSRKAEHQAESPKDAEQSWLRVERSWGSFERRLNLGDGVDLEKVAAEYKDGVLTITVPKKESAQPRQVEVR